MSHRVKGDGSLPPPVRRPLSESHLATQQQSKGGFLEWAMQAYQGFIWLITLQFTKVSFDNWSYKQNVAEKLSGTITDQYQVLNEKEKMVVKEKYETTLKMLSVDQLGHLNVLLTSYPKLGALFIRENIRQHPDQIKEILERIAIPKAKENFDLIYGVKQNNKMNLQDLFSLGQNLFLNRLTVEQSALIQKTFAPTAQPRKKVAEVRGQSLAETQNPLLETGHTFGVSKEGYHYEIHAPFIALEEMPEYLPPVEILVIDPKTQKTHLLIYHLPILDQTREEIKTALVTLESSIQAPFEDPDVEDVLQLLKSDLNAEVRMDNLVEQFKLGHIYLIDGELSLFLKEQHPKLERGISSEQIERTQLMLNGEILRENEELTLSFFADKKGDVAKLPCHVTSTTLSIGSKYYLDIQFTTRFKGKELTYMTRIPYLNEREKKEEVIERIGKNHLLERALLQARSAFSRQVVR